MKGEPLPPQLSWMKNPELENGYALCIDGNVIEFNDGPYGEQWITADIHGEEIEPSFASPENPYLWNPPKVYGTYRESSTDTFEFTYEDVVITIYSPSGGGTNVMTPEVTDIYQP